MLAQEGRILDECRDHQEGDDPDRHVDIEIPTPVPVVGDPAAQRRAHDRRDHQAHAPRRHRELLLGRRKGLHQDGLRRRHHRSACRTLDQAKHHHLIERSGRAAQRRGDHEDRHRDHEVAFAAEARRDPSGHRDHDAVGDQVAGQHPRNLVDAGGEAALHVRQRDVDDRSVQHLERGAEHHRQRD